MKRPEVWLGDLLRVFAALRPDETEAAAVAKMLQLERTSTDPEALRRKGAYSPAASPQHAAPAIPKVQVPPEPPPVPEPAGTSPAARSQRGAVRLVHAPAAPSQSAPPGWVPATVLMAPPAPQPPEPAAPLPLIRKRVQRAIFSAAAATAAGDGPPDVGRILDAFTRRRPLLHLPRLTEKTLRFGVQILADRGAGMTPFLADQQDAVKALRSIVAPDRCAHLRFTGCPARGAGTGPRDGWRPWSAPARRTVILLLTDLGIGGPVLDPDRAGPAEWLGFATAVQRAGCALAAFVPYEPARWPAELARAMTLIHWSERLTAGAIRHALGLSRSRDL